MARLLNNGVHITFYSDSDRAVYAWMEDWALTPQWINDDGIVETSKQIKKVFATPDRAFGMMRKLLGNENVSTHEASIPLPFYSITRLDPIFEPERDLAANSIRAYRTKQIWCDTLGRYISLAEYNAGLCPTAEFRSYDLSTKTEEEANEDIWFYEGSSVVPQPYMVTYQFDLWCKTLGEALVQQQQFQRQFLHGREIINVYYPEPFNSRDCLVDNPTYVNNSDLEPGEDNVNIRFSFTADVHCWLAPDMGRTGPVKNLDVDYYNLDG